jgi:methylthioribose-1-phosphate isomerase
MPAVIKHIKWDGNNLEVLDQKSLPQEEKWLRCKTVQDVFKVIKGMNIRGAPLIGIVAGFGVVINVKNNLSDIERAVNEAVELLSQARPTAVNLFWALERMKKTYMANKNKKDIVKILEEEANKIWEQDIAISERMAEYGAKFIQSGDGILTHCNAGALATGGYGTALGVIYKANEQGKNILVYVDETRPYLQGAKLTCWELKKAGIRYKLICDNMAGFIMKQKKIDKIFVGADRITKNGGFANKIGTYSLACLARKHNIPFYVVAPTSSFDFSLPDESKIPIEYRDKREIIYINGKPVAPVDSEVENPAFDITPPELVTAIICEKGVFRYPFDFSNLIEDERR